MTAKSEYQLEFFVTARKRRSLTTDTPFSVLCELSQPLS